VSSAGRIDPLPFILTDQILTHSRILKKRLAILLTFVMFPAAAFLRTTLKVEISNIKQGKGKIWIAVFRPEEKFGGDKPTIYKIVEVRSAATLRADFEIEPGRYALAVYHDLNENNMLDKNFVGIPKEPYGFSNDFRPRFSAPTFEDCAFDVPQDGRALSVKLTN
jgi:uncharacterized protein (DUF2141 family)